MPELTLLSCPPQTVRRLSASSPAERFERITRLARHIFDVSLALIVLADGRGYRLKAGHGGLALEQQHKLLTDGRPLFDEGECVVMDACCQPGLADHSLVSGDPFLRFYAGQPLFGLDGHQLGIFAIMDQRARQMDEIERQTLRDLAAWAENELNATERDRDMAERQRIEKTLAEQRTFLRQVIDTIPHFVFVRDRQGRFTLVNRAIAEAYNTTVEELLGKTDADFHPDQEKAAQFRRSDHEIMTSRKEVLIPAQKMIDVTGRLRWLQTIKRPIVDEAGVANQVLGIATDITERKQAEEERAHFTNQLRTAAEISQQLNAILNPDQLLSQVISLLQARFDLYHVHVYLLDEQSGDLVVRDASGEAGKTLLSQNHRISPDCRRNPIAQAARDREIVVIQDTRQEPAFDPNPFLPQSRAEVAVPLIASSGLLGVLDIHKDAVDCFIQSDLDTFNILAGQIAIALENARLFEEIQETAERLSEADRFKSEFLANMSHELRTPLNSIIGYAEMMLMGMEGELPDEVILDVKAIFNNGQHLLHIINEILDLAKIESGQLSLNLENISIGAVLDELRTGIAGLLGRKPIELRLEVEDNLPWIKADGVRVYQVLNNLVSNAIKFTNEGHICLRAFHEDGWVHIEVEDSGIGISDTDQQAIFEKFRQVDGSFTRRAEGTGLGLAITRHLVQMHNGIITVRSQPGQGTTFTVRLPLYQEESVETLLVHF